MADHDLFEAAHQWALAAKLARRHPSLHVLQDDMGAGNRVLKLTDFEGVNLWVPEYVVNEPPHSGESGLPTQVLWRGIEMGIDTIEEAEERAGIHPHGGELSHQAFSYSVMAGLLLEFVASAPLKVESGLTESQHWGVSVAEWWDPLAEAVETAAVVQMPRSDSIRSMYEARLITQYFRLYGANFELVFDATDAMMFASSRLGGYAPPVGLHALAGDGGLSSNVLATLVELGHRTRPD